MSDAGVDGGLIVVRGALHGLDGLPTKLEANCLTTKVLKIMPDSDS